MNALFGELNKGEAVTSGLRKVTDDMKAKNRTDRTGAVPSNAGSSSAPPPNLAAGVKPAGPPKFELAGKKWAVENQSGAKDLKITDCNARQTVYLYGCTKSVLIIEGKVNQITMDKCKDTAIVFQDVVASVEVVNCSSVEMQAIGYVPTIAVDNTSGCNIYLSDKSLSTMLTTAKSSALNVNTPSPKGPDEDPVETPLPEQFMSTYDPKTHKWTTVPVTHSAG